MFTNLNSEIQGFFRNFKPDDLKYLLRLIKVKRVLIASILGLILLAGFVLKIFISPEIEKARGYQKELAFITNNSLALENALAEHPNIDQDIELLKDRRKALIQNISPSKDFLITAQNVISELERHGIKMGGFKYLYDLKGALGYNFKRYGLELELVTSYLKFTRFLEDIEGKGNMFEIGRIKIVKINGDFLSIKLRMEFIMKEEI
ncbi:MAG: hypothetical protein P9M06_01230 [Candidatus Saelkia tenebricola]|nr:hypothetical protein [Candidatus Saelkia tenebricola]